MNCQPELLLAGAGRLARTPTTPMLWIYGQNDSFFAPPLAAAMYGAYTQNGGKGEFDPVGPFGQDGHRLFLAADGSQIWGPVVARYLATRPGQLGGRRGARALPAAAGGSGPRGAPLRGDECSRSFRSGWGDIGH